MKLLMEEHKSKYQPETQFFFKMIENCAGVFSEAQLSEQHINYLKTKN